MKQTTAEAVYCEVVKSLPLPERLKLATMILNDIPPQAIVDYSEEWSEEDIQDFTRHTLQYAAQSLGEEEEEPNPGISPTAIGRRCRRA